MTDLIKAIQDAQPFVRVEASDEVLAKINERLGDKYELTGFAVNVERDKVDNITDSDLIAVALQGVAKMEEERYTLPGK